MSITYSSIEMALHKLILEDDLDDLFSLIAIHCGVEEYKMAYLLNQHLGMQLKRNRVDLDFQRDGKLVTFAMYEFEDKKHHIRFNLIANVSNPQIHILESDGNPMTSLFSDRDNTYYLLPELRKVDYFIRIDCEYGEPPLREILSEINKIKHVISAYSVDVTRIKSKNNLIFD